MSIQRRKGKEKRIILLSIPVLIFLDQWLKALVYSNMNTGDSIPVIKDIFHITFVKNTGAAFGLFKNSTIFFIFISIIAIVVILSIIVKAIQNKEFLSNRIFYYGLFLILSGAIGNLIDRVRFGYVVDFIDVRIWPVFNIADSVITIGTFLLAISLLLRQKQN